MTDTLAADEFCRHQELLRWQVRLLNAAQGKFCEVFAEFFGELTDGSQSGMQDFADRIVEGASAHTAYLGPVGERSVPADLIVAVLSTRVATLVP